MSRDPVITGFEVILNGTHSYDFRFIWFDLAQSGLFGLKQYFFKPEKSINFQNKGIDILIHFCMLVAESHRKADSLQKSLNLLKIILIHLETV